MEESKKLYLLKITILLLISVTAISSRLFSVLRYESIIHEFDPWFNYRTTQYLVNNGFYEFWNWFDSKSWYPLGRVVGGTLFPGIMVTSATIYKILDKIGLHVDIRDVCVFLAPVFSSLTAIATYLITNEVQDSIAGLFAAAFMGVAPGYISRSVAGSYDNEGIAIFLLVFTFYLWLKSVRTGSMFYSCMTALFYFYMVSAWGGYVFIINMIPLHVFTLLLMGRYNNDIYVSYSTFYVIGTLASMQIPFVGFQPTFTSEHMASLGTFGLLQIFAFANYLNSMIPQQHFRNIFRTFLMAIIAAMFMVLFYLTSTKKIAPWTGRFYSLWDTGYAKIHVPIIASVSEHQPTAWSQFFMDLNILMWLFPVGLYFIFQKLTDSQIFLILYAVLGSYFAGVMVRLILTLTPIVCILSGIGASEFYKVFLNFKESAPKDSDESNKKPNTEPQQQKKELKKKVSAQNIKSSKKSTKPNSPFDPFTKSIHLFVVSVVTLMLIMFQIHSTWVTSNAYSSPSVVLASYDQKGNKIIIDDFREAYNWLTHNTKEDSKIMSWWDYGYQLAGLANRTTLVDNNTWNNTHIATMAKIFAADEETGYEIVNTLDVDYLLVVYGGILGYSGDDINKFLWMIRIGQGVYPNDLREEKFYDSNGNYNIGDNASPAMRSSIMHKLTYYRVSDFVGVDGMDRARQQKVPSKVTLDYFEEVFTSSNWMVRLYKPKSPDILGRSPPKSI
ncbi:hypothetical protein BB561_005245 [Smittium simulii]|uniref:dolichyl-diphosphooligosaccharide--protein glycotransferase n=1 Tax=Smittium simulii TaxID=133385 RepID=A0A2T9YBF1_9FUNG|nr:hypothetical protein BB561_005245 [Smittium simulii]